MGDAADDGERPVILLETPRLRLRRIVPADIDQLAELDADPQVMRYISFGEPVSRERYEQQLMPRLLGSYAAHPLLGYWVAELLPAGEFVGWFHLRPDRYDPDEQELGYRLRRIAWGMGLATEAGRALVAHGFERVGANKISARALAANRASRRVMEKCGLSYERDFEWPLDVMPGRTPAERAGVKYSLRRPPSSPAPD
jgi:RimJ/RimL family protein N-acetyltransferase